MRTDFSKFQNRLSEACQARGVTQPKLAASIGLSPRRSITLKLTAPGALDLYRVCQIADVLDVSLDWLTGRSNVMDVMEMPEPEPLRTPTPTPISVKRKGTAKKLGA